jgi:hypothetical protein
MRKSGLLFIAPFILLLSGCSSSYFVTFFRLSPQDLVGYVAIALIISFIAAAITNGERKLAFWFSFILSLLLTPLAGLIIVLIILTRKM